jgi:uncharacterized protein (TIGR03437 family)
MFYRRFQKLMIVVLLLLHTSAASFAATVIYAQNVKGLIYKSTDSAKTWQQLPPMTSAAVADAALAVDPQNSNNLYSIYDPGKGAPPRQGVFRSTDGGQTWVETLTTVSPPIAVDATASNIVYVFGDSGGKLSMLRSTDSGASFQAVTVVSPLPGGISVIRNDPSQPGTVYAVVSSPGGIYKSTDYGATWALFSKPSVSITDLAIDPKNSSVLYVAAYSSTCGTPAARCGLLKTSDAGKTWQAIFGDDCGNVVVDPRNGNIYAGGYLGTLVTGATPGGEIVRSTDGGKTFTRLTSGLTSAGAEVHLDPESPNVLYGSQSRTVGAFIGVKPAGVFVSTDSGATWTLGTVDPEFAPPNDQIYSLVALSIKNPPPGVVNVSAAGGRTDLFAPEAIVSAFGSGLATGTAGATTNPPLTTLGGATVTVTDSAGTSLPAELLYVSSGQINYIVPDGLAAGAATVAFNSGSSTQNQKIQLGPVAPGMFTFNAAGLVAGSVLRVSGDGTQTPENFYQLDGSGAVVPVPVNLGPVTDQVFLILYGTGFRAAGTANTSITIGGQKAQVSFAGPQGAFAGLDQVNVLVPRSLAGSGSVNVVLTASGQTANTVNISVQ